MLNMMLSPIRRSTINQVCKSTAAFYSRRSNAKKTADVYKVVKSDQTIDDFENTSLGSSPNWELLAPRGYRFYLPGSTGPGWHDTSTVAQVEDNSLHTLKYGKIIHKSSTSSFECVSQECPILLRAGVIELFPYPDISDRELTVITLTHKPDVNKMLRRIEIDTEREKIVKCFVLAAHDICTKLKMAGYWADFINPFSGRPYLSSFQNLALYNTDQKFRCLGFEIEDRASCKIIANEDKEIKKFMGSLFTTAPSSIVMLKDILNQYE